MPRVSVIMVTGGSRLTAFENTLRSWSRVTHPNFDFTLIYSGEQAEYNAVKTLIKRFPLITEFKKDEREGTSFARTTQIWRREGMASKGDYVVFAMADELLRDYDILQMMEKADQTKRVSINTLFLSPQHTAMLPGIDWESNPREIENLPNFWDDVQFEGFTNTSRVDNGKIVCHINGAYREYWEWLGWHRDDEYGYLNLDQDIITREGRLGKYPAITMSACYHQWHGAGNAYVPDEHRLPPYRYQNEAQARLLEPAERWRVEDMWQANYEGV